MVVNVKLSGRRCDNAGDHVIVIHRPAILTRKPDSSLSLNLNISTLHQLISKRSYNVGKLEFSKILFYILYIHIYIYTYMYIYNIFIIY